MARRRPAGIWPAGGCPRGRTAGHGAQTRRAGQAALGPRPRKTGPPGTRWDWSSRPKASSPPGGGGREQECGRGPTQDTGCTLLPAPHGLWFQPTPLVPTARFRTLLLAHGPSGLLTTRGRPPGSGPGGHKAPTILPNNSTPLCSSPHHLLPVSLPQLRPLHTTKGRVPSYQEDITFPPLGDVPFPLPPWATPG